MTTMTAPTLVGISRNAIDPTTEGQAFLESFIKYAQIHVGKDDLTFVEIMDSFVKAALYATSTDPVKLAIDLGLSEVELESTYGMNALTLNALSEKVVLENLYIFASSIYCNWQD